MLIIFEQRAPYFHLALSPADCMADRSEKRTFQAEGTESTKVLELEWFLRVYGTERRPVRQEHNEKREGVLYEIKLKK